MTKDKNTDSPAIQDILKHDLQSFAHSLGLYMEVEPLSEAKAVRALQIVERLSQDAMDGVNRDICLTICGLIWEHRQESWDGLPGILAVILSRLGYGPCIDMVETQIGAKIKFDQLGLALSATAQLALFQIDAGFDQPVTVTAFQQRFWKALQCHPAVCVSAPTSAGKSYILSLHVAKSIRLGFKTIVYIVPTVSLVRQVSRDLTIAVRRLNLIVDICQTVSPIRDHTPTIYVLTQERAYSAFVETTYGWQIELLIVDEVQNVERAERATGERAKILVDVIAEIAQHQHCKVVLSGPRLKNPAKLGEELLRTTVIGVEDYVPPVVNIAYTFNTQAGQATMDQHTTLSRHPISLQINQKSGTLSNIHGRTTYNENFYAFVRGVLPELTQQGGVLIFSPTAIQAQKTAIQLSESEDRSTRSHALERQTLAKYLSDKVHPKYGLSTSVNAGIGYHHGKMPNHARVAVEIAFSKGFLSTVACTTTLMQGVNLPAKTILIRNPHLFVRSGKDAQSLTEYEFANLRGRAGRLMKDFVGRAVVLDGQMFNSNQVGFDFPKLSVQPTIHPRFVEARRVILGVASSSTLASAEEKYKDIIEYIRYQAIRYGTAGLGRLRNAGIDIADDEYAMIMGRVLELSAPRKVLLSVPYWDPFEVQALYDKVRKGEVPRLDLNLRSARAVEDLQLWIATIQASSPNLLNRTIGSNLRSGRIWSISNNAIAWARGEKLRQILDWGTPTNSEIEDRLSTILNTIKFQLPRLMRPFLAMGHACSDLIAGLEHGAPPGLASQLIVAGLPRETAISVAMYNPTFQSQGEMLYFRDLRRIALSTRPKLCEWDRMIVDDTFPQTSE